MKNNLNHRQLSFKLSILMIVGISLFSCGQSAEEIAKKKRFEEEEKIKSQVNTVNESIKNNPVRFEKYLKKMQGDWIFQQTQPCVQLSKNKFGLTETNGGAGVCQQMKIIIIGDTYKAYFEEYGVKNNMLLRRNFTDGKAGKLFPINHQIETDRNPDCEGKIQLNQSNMEIKNNPNLANVICLTMVNTVCTEFGGSNAGQWNQLYWDDTKEALHWVFAKGGSNAFCDFNGLCGRSNGKTTNNIEQKSTEFSTDKNTIIATYSQTFWSPESVHPSVIFKGEDGKWLYFFLSEKLFNDKTFLSESDEEEKTNKANVGKKYLIKYMPKDNVQDNLGEIESYQVK